MICLLNIHVVLRSIVIVGFSYTIVRCQWSCSVTITINQVIHRICLHAHLAVVTGLIGVHAIHVQVHPIKPRYNYLVLCSPRQHHPSYLPIKTLVARQQSTSTCTFVCLLSITVLLLSYFLSRVSH